MLSFNYALLSHGQEALALVSSVRRRRHRQLDLKRTRSLWVSDVLRTEHVCEIAIIILNSCRIKRRDCVGSFPVGQQNLRVWNLSRVKHDATRRSSVLTLYYLCLFKLSNVPKYETETRTGGGRASCE